MSEAGITRQATGWAPPAQATLYSACCCVPAAEPERERPVPVKLDLSTRMVGGYRHDEACEHRPGNS